MGWGGGELVETPYATVRFQFLNSIGYRVGRQMPEGSPTRWKQVMREILFQCRRCVELHVRKKGRKAPFFKHCSVPAWSLCSIKPLGSKHLNFEQWYGSSLLPSFLPSFLSSFLPSFLFSFLPSNTWLLQHTEFLICKKWKVPFLHIAVRAPVKATCSTT